MRFIINVCKYFVLAISFCSFFDTAVAKHDEESLDPDAVDVSDDVQMDIFHKKYLKDFGKTYDKQTTELSKQYLKTWLVAYQRPNKPYTMGLNEDSDKSPDEFRTRLGQLPGDPDAEVWIKRESEPPPQARKRRRRQTPPQWLDYRGTGYVTSVKNQGANCGVCYAFAAAGGLEGQYYNLFGRWSNPQYSAVDIRWSGDIASAIPFYSPEQLIDCTQTPAVAGSSFTGNNGCSGGWSWKVFEYMKATGNKAMKDWAYAYTPYSYQTNPTCAYNGGLPYWYYLIGALHGSGTWYLPQTEASVETALYNVGPIIVTFNAVYPDFWTYRSGILSVPNCDYHFNHAVLLVGYNNLASPKYWIAKNSWGTGWGESGYFRLHKNAVGFPYGMCGVAYIPHYPDVQTSAG